jgi:hypothetical protein
MTVWGIIAMLIAWGVTAFVFFLFGRDIGEGKGYERIQEANERLLKENLNLKWNNNRLQRSMQYYDDGVLSRILEEMDEGKTFGYGSYPDSE